MLVPLGGVTSGVEPFYAPAVAFGDEPWLVCQRWLWPFHRWLTTGDLINYCDVQHRIIRLYANLVGLSTLIRGPRGQLAMGWWWIPTSMVVSWTMPISNYADPRGMLRDR